MLSYNKSIVTDAGTYSIDYFTFDFLLLTTSDLFDALLQEIDKLQKSCTKYQRFQSNKFGKPKEIIQADHLHLEFNPITYSLRVSFNPNKCLDSSVLSYLLTYLRFNCGVIAFRCSRCDYTYDIPYHPNDLMILSRKTEGHYKTTRYYGNRGSSGYLRLYDKREELKQRDKVDLGYDLCRLEWEQRNDESFTFDAFCIPDFTGLEGYARFIKYVDPAYYNAAIKEIKSPNTRSKLRKQLFNQYPFEPQNFDTLRTQYFSEYGLLNAYKEFPYMGVPAFDEDGEYVPVPPEVQVKRWQKQLNDLRNKEPS